MYRQRRVSKYYVENDFFFFFYSDWPRPEQSVCDMLTTVYITRFKHDVCLAVYVETKVAIKLFKNRSSRRRNYLARLPGTPIGTYHHFTLKKKKKGENKDKRFFTKFQTNCKTNEIILCIRAIRRTHL